MRAGFINKKAVAGVGIHATCPGTYFPPIALLSSKRRNQMTRVLYQEFLDERVENLQEAIMSHGVLGLLAEFEAWLHENNHVLITED